MPACASSTPAQFWGDTWSIAEAAWLGDAVQYEVALEADPARRIRVLRPTTEPAFAPGTPVLLRAGPQAVAWIEDFETLPGEAA